MQRDLYSLLSDDTRVLQSCTRVIFFVHEDEQPYPLLFFSRCLQQFASIVACIRLDLELHEEKDIYRELETTFLGQERTIWLTGFAQMQERKMTGWLNYLQGYTGPHRILCPMPASRLTTTSMDVVAVNHLINKRECTQLYSFLAGRALHAQELERITALYARHEKIELDTACLLFEYLQLVGRDAHEFMHDWLTRLVRAQSSLFALSQHFFARSLVPCMQQWAELKPLYSDQFWIAFWSDQIWRASWYIHYMRTKQPQQAKKMGFRLPYAFLQKDYRTYSVEQLRAQLNYLYMLDINLKQGGSSGGIDLFLYRFFAS